MSINAMPIRDPAPEPCRHFEVPGFDIVIIKYFRYYDLIEYGGTPDALVACGAVTPDMLVINGQRGPRVKRIDQDGHGWHVVRSFRRAPDGAAIPWFKVSRPVKGRLDHLPFGWKAFAAYKAWSQWDDEQRAADRAENVAAERRPGLRLVINKD